MFNTHIIYTIYSILSSFPWEIAKLAVYFAHPFGAQMSADSATQMGPQTTLNNLC
jgi:hypothetical protein